MDKKTYIIVTLSMILTVSLATFINIKHSEQERIDAQQQKLDAQKESMQILKSDYNTCLISASYDYDHDWNAQCFAAGKEDGCLLTSSSAQGVEERNTDRQDVCLEIYKAELSHI